MTAQLALILAHVVPALTVLGAVLYTENEAYLNRLYAAATPRCQVNWGAAAA